MTDVQKKALQELVKTSTWKLLKELIVSRVDDLKLDYTKSNIKLGEDAKAQYIAKNIIKGVLKEVESLDNFKNNKKSYK